jgi:TolA-binding protein
MATQSIKSQSRVASETLAQILEKQGLTDQAIKMYEQLILTFPEKALTLQRKLKI